MYPFVEIKEYEKETFPPLDERSHFYTQTVICKDKNNILYLGRIHTINHHWYGFMIGNPFKDESLGHIKDIPYWRSIEGCANCDNYRDFNNIQNQFQNNA